MKVDKNKINEKAITGCQKVLLTFLAALLLFPFDLFSTSFIIESQEESVTTNNSQEEALEDDAETIEDGKNYSVNNDRVKFVPTDTTTVEQTIALTDSITAIEEEWVPREIEFNPDPTKAVWLAALFPGLGQVYNRRYWKLPLIVGGYLGLGYATSWNNGMLNDYTKAYADIMDTDPTTKSYMDFFPSTVKEENLDKTWLTNILRSRKNYFRRNRDLCIIGMVGVYLIAIIDAYVDAQLAHFDISPDLSMDVYPSLIQDGRNRLPSMGLQWAITF